MGGQGVQALLQGGELGRRLGGGLFQLGDEGQGTGVADVGHLHPQALGRLEQGFLPLGQAVQLGLGGVQLGFGLQKGLFLLGQLGVALVQLGLGAFDLGGAAVDLGLAALNLGVAVRDLLPGGVDLIIEGGLAAVQLGLSALQLGLGVRQGLAVLVDLLLGVLQLGFGVRQFFLRVRPGLLVLGPGVVQFFLGVAHQGLVPELRPLRGHVLQGGLHRLHLVPVLVAGGIQLPGPLHREVQCGVVVHVKGLRQGVEHHFQGAGAGGGVFRFHGDIGGAAHRAHHGQGLGQGGAVLPLVFLVLFHRQGGADPLLAFHQALGLHDHALPGLLRHAAFQQLGAGQVVCVLLACVLRQGVDPGGEGVPLFREEHQVCVVGGEQALHPLHGGDGLHVFLGQPQGGHHPQVVEAGFVVQGVGGEAHVHGGHQKPRQKAHAQGHDGENGQKPGQAAPDGAKDVFPVGFH